MQLNETTLKTIALSIQNYFKKQGLKSASIKPPYLGDVGKFPTLDVSGLIQIYGDYNGSIYFTASTKMMDAIAGRLGFDKNMETYLDLIGEMTNIFAGNIREDLGSEFNISTPFNFEGSAIKNSMNFKGGEKPYILPISYWDDTAMLVIYFEKTK